MVPSLLLTLVAAQALLPVLQTAHAVKVDVALRNGDSAYDGAKAVGISTYQGLGSPGSWNANGQAFADSNHWCMGNSIPSSPVYDQRLLLKFTKIKDALKNAGIGANFTLVSAKLSLYAHVQDSNPQTL
jgi:hypothetical protein